MVAMVAVMDGGSILEQFGVVDGIVRNFSGHRHSKVAADVVKSFLVQQDLSTGVSAYEDTVRQLSADVCIALVEHYFYANARQHLIAEGKIADPGEARYWQDQMEQLTQPAIEKIADQLIRTPHAKGLRAPRRTARKDSISSLLEEELLPSPARVLA